MSPTGISQPCCLRRAISTSNISSAVTVLSGASCLLGNEYHEALQHKLIREANLGAKVLPAQADREKVKSCLTELADSNNAFKQALNTGTEQLVATINLE
ncbi:hypothetical protein JHK82_039104 [Glycine max]|nr:hypothetical protein JHK86_039283 [Glycine max]KAG4964890.1 hypothetical protein JHK85_039865 [Glycine max]KAG5109881.1 hypothetical protein JHK82_039104 [Glycine max]KAG5121173.1 hypothetical protein JHK84_039513 [Glycine max]